MAPPAVSEATVVGATGLCLAAMQATAGVYYRLSISDIDNIWNSFDISSAAPYKCTLCTTLAKATSMAPR